MALWGCLEGSKRSSVAVGVFKDSLEFRSFGSGPGVECIYDNNMKALEPQICSVREIQDHKGDFRGCRLLMLALYMIMMLVAKMKDRPSTSFPQPRKPWL